MNAAEIIKQIKTLSPQERIKVLAYFSEQAASGDPDTRMICYASKEVARAAGEKVLTEHAELFRKLAEYERQESSSHA
jgi:hypothetical protein